MYGAAAKCAASCNSPFEKSFFAFGKLILQQSLAFACQFLLPLYQANNGQTRSVTALQNRSSQKTEEL